MNRLFMAKTTVLQNLPAKKFYYHKRIFGLIDLYVIIFPLMVIKVFSTRPQCICIIFYKKLLRYR